SLGSSSGSVSINYTSIQTGGGNITATGGSASDISPGVILTQSTLAAGGGAITLAGTRSAGSGSGSLGSYAGLSIYASSLSAGNGISLSSTDGDLVVVGNSS